MKLSDSLSYRNSRVEPISISSSVHVFTLSYSRTVWKKTKLSKFDHDRERHLAI